MLKKLIKTKYLRLLFFYTLFCFSFIFIRNIVENNFKYNFLIWNLFLGFLPFLIAIIIQQFEKQINNLLLIIGSAMWLLFYPNSPYIITNLIHIQASSTSVLYDTLLIFSFSMLSLFFGFYSLKLLQTVLIKKISKNITYIILFVSLLLSSFGIYLGRILRLNSWDVFVKPLKVFSTVFEHLFPITKNPETYTIIILFSLIQLFLLFLMKDIDEV